MLIGGGGWGLSFDNEVQKQIFQLRWDRTWACLAVGASLGLAGYLLQLTLDNPLAEPYTLGISGGATLGALSALLLAIQPLWLFMPIGALMGCLIVTGLIFFVLPSGIFERTRSLILFGLMISLFCGSLVVLMISLLDPSRLSSAILWTMGFAGTERDAYWPLPLAVFVSVLIWTLRSRHKLDALLLGDGLLRNVLPNPLRVRKTAVWAVSALTACSVALMGLIGFVGLIAPHVASLLQKSRRVKAAAPLSAICGAVLLLFADVLGRGIGDTREIPAGSLTALIGAPVLIYLILKRWRHV